ncbi:hypothetical protein SJ05684_c30440 [Sinorhizobium sojae CCBAU 05684]|uniref:Terminase small subunit n=1 Tax=Sinorhizobium sojae CCBAU 05684 TaxID=716928 RepID=A0A249PEW8_9HYPH|nr:hypothetical protein [Sinorhizobium sojae]ASY64468.1 hypothetical protein SJ05684_c30440 [Sinorhizobium sojae CCBAU 05684]
MGMPSKTTADYRHAGQKAAAALRKEKKEPRLTDKQRALIDFMVHEGMDRKRAAEAAGVTDETARLALRNPQVLAYLNEEMEVLRTGARPRALRKMADLLDAKTERIQFEAAKYLDGMDRPSHAVGATQVNVQVTNTVNVTPGYVIDLRPGEFNEAAGAQQIEHLAHEEAISLEELAVSEDVPLED